MEGRFPLSSKKYMEYCLALNSDYKFGKNIEQTKLPVRNSYNKTLPDYILNKPKTGWSVPIINGLVNLIVLKKNILKLVVEKME